MKDTIANLKNEIKRLAAQGRDIAGQIKLSSGPARYELWQDKRALGLITRYHLLAYALLRGVPYWRVEPGCRPGNEPSATQLHDLVSRLLSEDLKANWSPEPTRNWLRQKAPTTEAKAA